MQTLIPLSQEEFPHANVGDVLAGATKGPLDYTQYGGYTIMATRVGTLRRGGIKLVEVTKAKAGEFSLATYNVENLAQGNPDSKFAQLASAVVRNLASPDIVALEEIQDNDGARDDGVVAADKTLQKFVDAIKTAGGPTYEWRQINPENDADGGEPGGNIRQVFMFNPARVSFVDIPGGDATTAVNVRVVQGKVQLSASPGRISPGMRRGS